MLAPKTLKATAPGLAPWLRPVGDTVEQELYRHPAVREVAVVGVPDVRWDETPVATVALQNAAETTAEELIAYARERLARFKCPTRVEFVAELPRTATGKVL